MYLAKLEMPPCLDIYIVAERSQATVDKFLTLYADLEASHSRDDYEVWRWDTEEYIKTGTLNDTIAYGLSNSRRSFTLYIREKATEFNRVMLHFGMYGQLVLGLSIEESIAGIPNDAAAEQAMIALKTAFNAEKGIVKFELPPVDAADELASI